MTTQTELLRDALEAMLSFTAGLNPNQGYDAEKDHPAVIQALAALTQPEQPARQGWKRVPVEPTIAMCMAGDAARLSTDDATRSAPAYRAMLAASPTPPQAELAEAVEMSPEFTDTARAALLWVLWHHQGSTSKVGQPIRFTLGMGQHEHLNEHQVREAKRWGGLAATEAANPETRFPKPSDDEIWGGDDSTRTAIGERVVDAAVEMQREVMAKPEAERAGCPDDIRALGWTVAVHNDYRLHGEAHTFWLFTKGDRCAKGEGRTDADALNQVRTLLSADSKDAGEPVAMPFEIALSELIDKICPGLDSGNILDDAKQASAALSDQIAKGEIVGHHKVGFGEMPTIHWRDGYWPTVGTKLYTRPQAADAQPLTDEKRGFMVMGHLGPAALTGGKMSVYDAFMLGIDATEKEHGITGKDNAS